MDGLRGDLVTAKTARALAAWEARDEVVLDDVKRAALLALSHRRRRGPFEQPGIDPEETRERPLRRPTPTRPTARTAAHPLRREPGRRRDVRQARGTRRAFGGADRGGGAEPLARRSRSSPCAWRRPRRARGGPLGRQEPRRRASPGIPVGDREDRGNAGDVALAATVRAAAPHQRARGREGPGSWCGREDLRAERAGGEGGEPDPLPRRRERLDGRPQTHVRREGRRPLPAERRLPAPRQGRPDLLPGRRRADTPAPDVERRAGRLPPAKTFRPVAARPSRPASRRPPRC